MWKRNTHYTLMNNNKMIHFFLPWRGFVGQRIFSLPILFFPLKEGGIRGRWHSEESGDSIWAKLCDSGKTERESKTVPNKPLTCVMQIINTCGTERKGKSVRYSNGIRLRTQTQNKNKWEKEGASQSSHLSTSLTDLGERSVIWSWTIT